MLFNKYFDLIFSIGEDCACTSYLRKFNLQDFSYPFDWLTGSDFQTRINLLLNDFDKFCEYSDFEKLEKSNSDDVDSANDSYLNTHYGLMFFHDFNSEYDFENAYKIVSEKYRRRIARLFDNIENSQDILLVWWSRDKHLRKEDVENAYSDLKRKFADKNLYILIIEFAEEYQEDLLLNGHILIVRYDNISYSYNQNWSKVLGNQTNNLKLFSQIKKKRNFYWFLKMFIYKTGRFLLGLLPFRKYRHHLRDKWRFTFFRDKL